jgi:signal transduction histidine kinase
MYGRSFTVLAHALQLVCERGFDPRSGDMHRNGECTAVAEGQGPENAQRSMGSENEALHSRAAELTTLSRHLFLVAEEEKAELARELHDTFGSNLTAINMDLNWIAKRLPEDRPELRERLQRALRMLGETVRIKQGVIDRLRPSQLDTLGLAVALRTYCREMANRIGVNCEIDASEDFEGLDRTCSIALYRVAEEALAHVDSETTERVRLGLSHEERGIRLRIHDEGPGLARVMKELPPAAEGLVGMRERVRAVGGTLQITQEGRGAIVEAFIPLGR